MISYPTDDYMADLVLHLAADGAEIVTTAINAWAVKTGRDDRRTADQRRADAIVDIFPRRLRLHWRGDPHPHALALPDLPTQHGIKPTANLEPLCRRHHNLKHHSRWRVQRHDDGSYAWTSPTRHTYRYRPPELPTPDPEPEATLRDDEPPPF